LIVPKRSAPDTEQIVYHASMDEPAYLPPGINWYYYWSGQPIPGSDQIMMIPIADNEQGVFIREGSIIPLLNFERHRMSLLQAIDDPVNLLIYPDLSTDTA
jgi:alpha-glucosidase (family GH31 glycosyl hydrolase)